MNHAMHPVIKIGLLITLIASLMAQELPGDQVAGLHASLLLDLASGRCTVTIENRGVSGAIRLHLDSLNGMAALVRISPVVKGVPDRTVAQPPSPVTLPVMTGRGEGTTFRPAVDRVADVAGGEGLSCSYPLSEARWLDQMDRLLANGQTVLVEPSVMVTAVDDAGARQEPVAIPVDGVRTSGVLIDRALWAQIKAVIKAQSQPSK